MGTETQLSLCWEVVLCNITAIVITWVEAWKEAASVTSQWAPLLEPQSRLLLFGSA
jgi:hypothetical protein